MATFKVGQRVRILPSLTYPQGDEGTVVAINQWHELFGVSCYVLADQAESGCPKWGRVWNVANIHLAPLTDPDSKADEFIAKLKKLGPLPVKEVA